MMIDQPYDPPSEANIDWEKVGFDVVAVNAVHHPSGLIPDGHTVCGRLPQGVIAFTALKSDAKDLGAIFGGGIPTRGMLPLTVGQRNFFYFRVEQGGERFDKSALPDTVRLLQAGDIVPLPLTTQIDLTIASISEIVLLSSYQLRQALGPKGDAEIANSPLSSYSLRGRAAEFEKSATESKPLLGDLCLSGQATVFYAAPNVGKTLITLRLVGDAVADGRINPGNIYYVNADDSSAGFATKMRLMDDLGVHTLSPGLNGLKTENLINLLGEVAEKDKARGSLIILDTVKKFVSLMDKSKASAFTQACRQVAMRGGTILGLAHTTKSPNANGSQRYAGTTDMVDDFDAAYTIAPIDVATVVGEKVVLFEAIKRRGNNAVSAGYAYAAEGDISYEERLASVRLVDPVAIDDFQRVVAESDDVEVIAAITACIRDGVTAKMALAKEASSRAGISERAAVRLIETYTGDDPLQHHWTYAVQQRGAKVFSLIPKPDAESDGGGIQLAA
jgi:hypothetical protein